MSIILLIDKILSFVRSDALEIFFIFFFIYLLAIIILLILKKEKALSLIREFVPFYEDENENCSCLKVSHIVYFILCIFSVSSCSVGILYLLLLLFKLLFNVRLLNILETILVIVFIFLLIKYWNRPLVRFKNFQKL